MARKAVTKSNEIIAERAVSTGHNTRFFNGRSDRRGHRHRHLRRDWHVDLFRNFCLFGHNQASNSHVRHQIGELLA